MVVLRQTAATHATKPQLARLFAKLRDFGLEREDLDELLAQMGLPEDPKALTQDQYQDVYKAVLWLGGNP